jgi:predicted XRE-type DNA-binding protein
MLRVWDLSKMKPSAYKRFMSVVIPVDSGCWIWTGYTDKDGYGSFKEESVPEPAHRVMYRHIFGDIPEVMIVRHSCHNPPCVNPEHLEVGTHEDNMRDMVEAGRQSHQTSPPGENNGNANLTEDQVTLIRHLYDNKMMNQYELSAVYKVSQGCISHIVRRLSWKHVKEE